MGRLRTAEIRQKRAAARRVAQARRVGTDVTCRVLCSHSEVATGCALRVVLAPDDTLLHVSSACSRTPPSDKEVAVVRALSGSAYKCCAPAVGSVIEYVKRGGLYNATEPAVPAVAMAAVRTAAAASLRVMRNRDGHTALGADVRNIEVMKEAAVERLTAGLPLPARWKLSMWHGGRIDMAIGKRGASRTVARYYGGGRFEVKPLHDFAKQHNGHTCDVCQKSFASPTAHARSNRHYINTRDAVLTVLEELSLRFTRRDRSPRAPA